MHCIAKEPSSDWQACGINAQMRKCTYEHQDSGPGEQQRSLQRCKQRPPRPQLLIYNLAVCFFAEPVGTQSCFAICGALEHALQVQRLQQKEQGLLASLQWSRNTEKYGARPV